MTYEIIKTHNFNSWKFLPFYDFIVTVFCHYIASTCRNGTIHEFIVIWIFFY